MKKKSLFSILKVLSIRRFSVIPSALSFPHALKRESIEMPAGYLSDRDSRLKISGMTNHRHAGMTYKWLAVIFLNVFIFSAPALVASAQNFFVEDSLTGKTAPGFTLQTLNSGKQTFSIYRRGQKAILFFWATWCPHCRARLNGLHAQMDTIEKQGIKLVLIDLGEEDQTVRSYLERQKMNLEVFLDKEQTLAGSYALIGVPTFIFVNESGKVTNVAHDLPENLSEMFKKQ